MHACALWQVHNPSTGEVIAKVPQMRANETKAAIAAASAAYPAWCKKTAKERGAVMRKCGPSTVAPAQAMHAGNLHRGVACIPSLGCFADRGSGKRRV